METTHMTLLNTIRAEGSRSESSIANKIGFNYAISILGTFDDFKNGHVVIRLRQRGGNSVRYSDLVAQGLGLEKIKSLYKDWFIRVKRRNGCDTPPDDIDDKFKTFQSNHWANGHMTMPITAGGKVSYTELCAEGKSEEEIEQIFNDRRRKHTDLVNGSLRHDIYTEFMKIVGNWKPETYRMELAATKLPDYLEKYSDSSRPAVRTSFCSLVGRMMSLARRNHRLVMKDQRNIETKQIAREQETAWNKQAAKREILKQKMGTDAFNAKKHRDKAASSIRKAEKVSSMPGRIERFLEFRRSARGRSYDNTMTASVLGRPSYEEPPKRWTALGHTSRAVLASFVRKYVNKVSNMKIQFHVDPCNIRTTLFQHVAVAGEGVLPLSNTNDFDSKGKTYTISAWFEHAGNMYVNLDRRQVTCHRKLPKEWADFERWCGYGVHGNPQNVVSLPTLIKIVSHNILSFSFSKDGVSYSIGHTGLVGMQKSMTALEGGIKDKYSVAAGEARKASAAWKEQRARDARARQARTPAPNKSLKAKLAQQLAEGLIDMETFKMGMSALS